MGIFFEHSLFLMIQQLFLLCLEKYIGVFMCKERELIYLTSLWKSVYANRVCHITEAYLLLIIKRYFILLILSFGFFFNFQICTLF